MTGHPKPQVPRRLVDAIGHGRCVAFVGAGFSAPAVPTWTALLASLADHCDQAPANQVASLIGRGAGRDLEAAAQIIRDSLSDEATASALDAALSDHDPNAVAERVRMLLSIPFRAILTTNFDPILSGRVPDPDVYLSVLRNEARWTNERFWDRRGASRSRT